MVLSPANLVDFSRVTINSLEANCNHVHKLLGNFLATFGSFGYFQLVEQLSMHWATSKFLCLYGHSHAPAMSATQLKSAEYKNMACIKNIFFQSFSYTIR